MLAKDLGDDKSRYDIDQDPDVYMSSSLGGPEAVGTGRDSVPLLLLLLAAPASTRSLSILTPCARADALTPQRLRAAART